MPAINLSARFGQTLRAKRESAGLSQERLAELSGLTRNYISMLERGQRNPTLNAMAELARAMSLTLGQLLEELLAQ